MTKQVKKKKRKIYDRFIVLHNLLVKYTKVGLDEYPSLEIFSDFSGALINDAHGEIFTFVNFKDGIERLEREIAQHVD